MLQGAIQNAVRRTHALRNPIGRLPAWVYPADAAAFIPWVRVLKVGIRIQGILKKKGGGDFIRLLMNHSPHSRGHRKRPRQLRRCS
jgi:hypothetical protein